MEFSYQIEVTKDHFIELNQFMWSRMRNQPEVRKWFGRVSLLLLISVAALTVFVFDFASSDPPLRQSTFLVISGVFLVGWILASRWHYAFSLGQWTVGSRTFLGKQTLKISDQGLSAEGLWDRSECMWDAVTDVVETENLVVFFTDPSKGYICPKDSIPGAEYDRLLSYSRDQVSN